MIKKLCLNCFYHTMPISINACQCKICDNHCEWEPDHFTMRYSDDINYVNVKLTTEEEKIESLDRLKRSKIEIIDYIHVRDWNKLLCPLCCEEIWSRCFERVDYYIVGTYGCDENDV